MYGNPDSGTREFFACRLIRNQFRGLKFGFQTRLFIRWIALSTFLTAGACSIYEARNLANDWNLESTFHGQGILNPVPAIRDLQHKIRNPQRAIQKPRFSLMHLILEECQPVSRRVSFHKRRSSVRKSEKDAIGSHLIQAADNVPRKLKFRFLDCPYCLC